MCVVAQAGVMVDGIMGTSAGALTGSLYAAGYTPKEVSFGAEPCQRVCVCVCCAKSPRPELLCCSCFKFLVNSSVRYGSRGERHVCTETLTCGFSASAGG